MLVPAKDLAAVQSRYDADLFLQAWEAARAIGPLADWEGTRARVLAGRLATHLGAARLGRRLHACAFRAAPADLEARFFHGHWLLTSRGPVAALDFVEQHPATDDAPREALVDWLALHADALAGLRDFEAAEARLASAAALAPGSPWLAITRARILEAEDRCEEAHSGIAAALARHPDHGGLLQSTAAALTLLGRQEEAIALLAAAADRLERGALVLQLADLEIEAGRPADAGRHLERVLALSPLADPGFREAIELRRAETDYRIGDSATAGARLRGLRLPVARRIGGRLAVAGAVHRRVHLPVPFVRQDHVTCSPATLTAIARFWSRPASHLEVAEEICYDGTPSHSERRWAEANGWETREFTCTTPAARAVLDRGVPFVLSTFAVSFGHAQAVMGYDSARGTLLVRDPSAPSQVEVEADLLFASQAACGPRAMALVPATERERLAGLDLPDSGLYDRAHRLQLALAAHDRSRASAELQALEDEAADHHVTLHAQRALAAYDADPVALLLATEALLERWPGTPFLELGRLAVLQQLARRPPRLEALERLARPRDAHPAFVGLLAGELLVDAASHPRAERLARRTLSLSPVEGESHRLLAEVLWRRGRHEEALRHHRFAACLSDKNEPLAMSYFDAAAHLGRSDEARRFLEGRLEAARGRASGPACTLFVALERLGRLEEGFAVLDSALLRRPEDGDLLLFAARARSRYGDQAEAARLLRAAGGRTKESWALRAAAEIAVAQGDRDQALSRWRQILRAEPLAPDAHAAVAQLLATTRGRAAALEHLEEATRRFPFAVPIQILRVEWLRRAPIECERAVRALLAAHPHNAWAQRELGIVLVRLGRLDEARAAADQAERLEPASPAIHDLRGEIHAAAGENELARACWRRAITIEAGDDYAIGRLVDSAASTAVRREDLALVQAELERQGDVGDGLLAFAGHAAASLEPEALDAALAALLARHSATWQAWSARSAALAWAGRAAEAVAAAREAAERFPLLVAVWLDLARAGSVAGDLDTERAALARARRLDPGSVEILNAAAGTAWRAGERDEARQLLELACARAPFAADTHTRLARTLWELGEREAAITRLRRALWLDPSPESWSLLGQWAAEVGRPDDLLDLARELTRDRPLDPGAWLALARLLPAPASSDERLAALAKAKRLDPLDAEARDLEAATLAEAGRFAEAAAACRPEVWGESPPVILRGRAAWVLAAQGDRKSAIARMRELLAAEPRYRWGWRCLHFWCSEEGDLAGAVAAAAALAETAPEDVQAHVGVAEARLAAGERAAAMAGLRRARGLLPEATVLGLMLADLALEDGDLPAAFVALDKLDPTGADPDVLSRRSRLAAAGGHSAEALAGLERLARLPGADPRPLAALVEHLVAAGCGPDAEKVLWGALPAPDLRPQAAALWVALHRRFRKLHDTELSVEPLASRGEVAAAAFSALVEALAEEKQASRLRRFIARHRAHLSREPNCWGSVGYALLQIDDVGGCVSWLADWRERGAAKPWMLWNLVIALRRRAAGSFFGSADTGEARAVSEGAIAIPEEDSSTPRHRLLVAVEAALAGEAGAARAHLARVPATGGSSYDQALRDLAEALLAAAAGAGDGAGYDLTAARRSLRAAGKPPEILALYYRSVACLARARGGAAGLLWRLAVRLRPL